MHIYGATDALLGTDRPILLKSTGAINGRLVGTRGNRHIVCATVGGDTAFALGTAARIVCAVGFDHVVFDEWVASPAVDGEVTVALGIERAAVVDCAEKDL